MLLALWIGLVEAPMEATIRVGNVPFRVVLNPTLSQPLQVWRAGSMVSLALRKSYHPWRLEIADVDGNGRDDIVVGVTKSTDRIRFQHRTIYVMHFDGQVITRMWTGSTMGRPLIDFCFGPKSVKGTQPLYTLERTLVGDCEVTAHEWTGFGFRKVGHPYLLKSGVSMVSRDQTLRVTTGTNDIVIPLKDLR